LTSSLNEKSRSPRNSVLEKSAVLKVQPEKSILLYPLSNLHPLKEVSPLNSISLKSQSL